ncbi:DctP family TRAP transporter solute-binding subunit [Pelomonas aquatica]|uniref:DctP family TRAP transporter solute-binding subunit n=1 Tax=Pelomonas aquatica TaxID=431058 RepID=UPI00360D0BCD
MTRRTFLQASLALGLTCALAPILSQAQSAPIVIKFSHVAAVDTPKGQGAERFKKLAEERTKGRVKVEVYPNSQLYKDKEELEALQLGSVQMLAPSVSKFGPFGVKEFEVFDLPFVTPDQASYLKAVGGDFGAAMLKKLDVKGVHGLAFWDAGFRVITANKPLRKPEDFKGLKIRINSSKVIDAQMRALGVMPQTIAFSEVYQALQTGVVDGADVTLSNVYTQKLYEVQKYVTLLHHSHQVYAVVVNRKFWEGLPKDLRSTLESAMADATTYANGLTLAEDRNAYDKIKAAGKAALIEPTPAERDAIRAVMVQTHKDVEGRLGRETMQALYKATEFNAGKR